MAREVRPILWPTILRTLRDARLRPQALDRIGVVQLDVGEGAAELRDRLQLALGAQRSSAPRRRSSSVSIVVALRAVLDDYLIGGRGSLASPGSMTKV